MYCRENDNSKNATRLFLQKKRIMKKMLSISLLSVFTSFSAAAQLPNGSTAPNFILTDIDGTTHDLYSYLDAGKTVYIDFFAAHCPTCWAYKNSGAMEDLYISYGPSGSVHQDIVILAIELDANNGANELNGISGFTQGDWATSVPYPIINPEGTDRTTIVQNYAANYYPLIYGICPDRTISVLGTVPTATLYTHYESCQTASSTEKEQEESYFSYNSTNQTITIEKEGDFILYDLTGKILLKRSQVVKGESIQVPAFIQGIHFVSFMNETRLLHTKIYLH